jgi:fatty-acyl-CoA synthase
MADLGTQPIRTKRDLEHFISQKTLAERLPEQSIYDVFVQSAERAPNATALTMLMTGAPNEQPRRITYSQLLAHIRQAANLFTEIGGAAPGVAFMLPSLVETHFTLWGAETAGYAVPINFLLQPESIAELIKASGVKILVALGPHPQLDIWEKATALRDQIPDLTLVRVAPPGTPEEEGIVDFGAALSRQPDDHLTFGTARSGDQLSAYFHTGGTTGVPKLVAHTHRSQLVAAFGGATMIGYTQNDILTATFPLFHVAGTIAAGLAPFIAGTQLLIMTPAGLRNPAVVEGFWRMVADHNVTVVGGVPTAIGAVLQAPMDGHDISAVRAGITGASLLPPAVGQKFQEVTGRTLFEILGMTEASGLISIDPVSGTGTTGSVGWALPYTQVDVLKLNNDGSLGEVCDVQEIGVISIQGDHLSPGYSDPAHNQGVFANGVLNSGDLGYKDAQGCLYVAGRSKDLIIRSGHNIDPTMIENAMSTHPAVALAAAVGMPDTYAGELPMCFVQLHPDSTVTIDELMEHARTTIDERPAWPKIIQPIEAIPLTSVGKIYKPSLRCNAAQTVVEAVVHDHFGLKGADVAVATGGPRGLCVTVTLRDADETSVTPLKQALDQFLFEAQVKTA